MYFQHSPEMWRDFPELAAGVVYIEQTDAGASFDDAAAAFGEAADAKLAGGAESELAPIQAWRRTFSKMGLKPTQYRCASEALLRRWRKEHSLPQLNPLIDLCNAASLAFAIPVAVFDTAHIAGGIEVRHAAGDESYLTFSGETENPEPGEVVFADAANRAHARRWTNRQSGLSAVSAGTTSALIVAEALHDSAAEDVRELVEEVLRALEPGWAVRVKPAVLQATAPRFEFGEA